MKPLVTLIGLLLVVAGLFFMGQGSGFIRWPAESFMINAFNWVYYGAAIVAVGVVLMMIARR